jgi:mannose-6-phosphate isomerase-like protein (cupin superfamily)
MPNTPHILFQKGYSSVEKQQLGPYGLESLISAQEEIHMTAYRVTVAPYSTTAVGYHQLAEEIYYVLVGSGTAVLNGAEQPLHAGDFLRLPPGTKHGFITEAEPLVMLDIHSPGSRPDRDIYFEAETPEGFNAKDQP